MAPLREILCKDCGHIDTQLLKSTESPEPCPHCESKRQEVLISAHGGYQGDLGSASTKPKGAGSFRRSK